MKNRIAAISGFILFLTVFLYLHLALSEYHFGKSGGSGLGMPIAKKVIEGHRGKIKVSSKPGQGTEVMIELPS